jgi:hypothetical protein
MSRRDARLLTVTGRHLERLDGKRLRDDATGGACSACCARCSCGCAVGGELRDVFATPTTSGADVATTLVIAGDAGSYVDDSDATDDDASVAACGTATLLALSFDCVRSANAITVQRECCAIVESCCCA